MLPTKLGMNPQAWPDTGTEGEAMSRRGAEIGMPSSSQ